jgi:sigma-B regulation protein RsbU (phosphoserine phosphatase)
VLLEKGWADRLDEALLLLSELSTNGVIHAGTALDVDVMADDQGVTITVSDHKSGLVGNLGLVNDEADRLDEHGRGLLLVDQLATSWGTRHDSHGKGVWFRLERRADERGTSEEVSATTSTGRRADERGTSEEATTREASLTPEACVWLVHVPEELRLRLSMPQLVSELLVRLCEVTGAVAATVWFDRGDGLGEQLLTRYETSGDAGDELVVPLPVNRPTRGSLVLHAAPGDRIGPHWPALAGLSAQRMAIGIDAERLHDADVRRRGWLTFLAEASELLAQSLDVQLTVALVPQIVVPRLGEWCAVHVRDPDGELRLAAIGHADEDALPRLRELLGNEAGPEVRKRLAEALGEDDTVALIAPTEGVAVPLTARGNVLGTMSVGRHADRVHVPDDIAVIEDVARRASLAIDNARAHAERTQIAQDLQRALLPSDLPVAPGLEFGAEYVPASTGSEVGGDFYDVVQIRRNRWLLSIGDVCGKGTQAAAVTGVVRDVVRALVRDNRSLPRTLQALNRTLLGQNDANRYCTVATAVVTRRDESDGERLLEVQLCLAGHDRPILLHADGTTQPVGECGTAVGLLENIDVAEVRLVVAPGEALVFFTDGVTERRHGREQYGLRRLRRQLRSLAGHPAQVVAARVRSAVVGFSTEPPRDDIAVVVLRNP